MKKSILAILLGVLMIAVMLPVHVLADESETPAPEETKEYADSESEEIYSEMSNIFGDDLEYGIDAEGVLYVGGTGSMKNEVPWRGREDEIRAVNIGYDVTDISPGAFENCKYLTSASLGWSVRVIGDGAFKNCTSLKEITIPNELTYIGNELFYNCSSLTTVTFPGIDKITEIGESAFYKCSKLTKIEIPATVTHIRSYAFSYCSALTEINMPEFADLGVQSFRGCTSLSKIRFDAHNDNIYVKDGMAIGTYDDSLGYPREQVEFCLGGLTGELTLPDSVTDIGSFAFENSPGIKKITIGKKVSNIIEYAFTGLDQAELVVDPDNSTYRSYGGAIYDKEMTKMLFAAGGKNGKITVPEGVTRIDNCACVSTGLIDITLPSSLKEIGADAFRRCTSMTSIVIPKNVTLIENSAFADCSALHEITFKGETPPRIYNWAFENVTANAYYPYTGPVWSSDWGNITQNPSYYQYDGNITWIEVKKQGWEQDGDVWHYYFSDGEMAKDTTVPIDDEWCDFDVNGVWISGWRFDGTNWYDVNGNIRHIDITAMKFKKAAMEIPVGTTQKAEIVFTPENGSADLNWKSSAPGVAAVDSSGNVTAKKVGKTTISASAQISGKTVTIKCTVSVLFKDVTSKGYSPYTAIYELNAKGIVAGFSDGTFKPNDPVTRGQVLLFLWRSAKQPEPKAKEITFKDAAEIKKLSTQYQKAILWGVEQGITEGYSDGTFRPNQNCTRGQIVTFLWRYKKKPAAKTGYTGSFPDVPKSHSFYKAVSWAASYKITAGFSDGTFGPTRDCTRGQCVAFIYRMLNL